MATLYTVLTTLQQQVSAATAGLTSLSPDTPGQALTVEVGLYWPSAKALQNSVRKTNGTGPTSLVTIYDRGIGRDSTRWLPAIVGFTPNPATMTVALSDKYVQPNESMTITIGGAVSLGDAIGINLTPSLFNSQAIVASAGATDTPSTMAAQVASLLQANATIASWVGITVAGPVVTLTSLAPAPGASTGGAFGALPFGIGGFGQSTETLLATGMMPAVVANVGNSGTNLVEIGRRNRHFQIVVWSRTPDDRITVGDPVEAMIATLEANFGLTFPDGTMGRVLYSGDTMHDEATLSDVMRRDFFLCVEYGINTTDVTYSVLAPVVQNTTF